VLVAHLRQRGVADDLPDAAAQLRAGHSRRTVPHGPGVAQRFKPADRFGRWAALARLLGNLLRRIACPLALQTLLLAPTFKPVRHDTPDRTLVASVSLDPPRGLGSSWDGALPSRWVAGVAHGA
jgi:hypothetical protein